jgi:hypothetical protein
VQLFFPQSKFKTRLWSEWRRVAATGVIAHPPPSLTFRNPRHPLPLNFSFPKSKTKFPLAFISVY